MMSDGGNRVGRARPGLGRAGVAVALAVAMLAATGAAAPDASAQVSDGFAFLKAVRERDGDKATKIIDGGANVINTRDIKTGETPLLLAAQRRDTTWLRYLIGKGANPDLGDRTGRTPLHAAALIGWAEGIELLLDAKANVNVLNGRGETALILAVQRRDASLARLLVERGADPDRADRIAGMSARDYARRDDPSGAMTAALAAAKARPATPVFGPKLP